MKKKDAKNGQIFKLSTFTLFIAMVWREVQFYLMNDFALKHHFACAYFILGTFRTNRH